MATPDRGPRVFVPPPFIFVAGWIVAWLLDRRVSFAIDGAGPSVVQSAIGAALIALGLGVMAWGIVTFRRFQTPIVPVQPARLVVMDGPYRRTRNPMYLGLSAAYVGLAALLNHAWPLVLLPVLLIVLSTAVIAREERHLRAKFGADYDAYCARVRRWI